MKVSHWVRYDNIHHMEPQYFILLRWPRLMLRLSPTPARPSEVSSVPWQEERRGQPGPACWPASARRARPTAGCPAWLCRPAAPRTRPSVSTWWRSPAALTQSLTAASTWMVPVSGSVQTLSLFDQVTHHWDILKVELRSFSVLVYVELLSLSPWYYRRSGEENELFHFKSLYNIFLPKVYQRCESSQDSHLYHEEGGHHHCRHELLANMWIARHHWSRNQNLTKSSHSRDIFRRVRLPQIIFAEKWTAEEDPSSRQTLFYSYQRREFGKFSGSEIFLILIK